MTLEKNWLYVPPLDLLPSLVCTSSLGLVTSLMIRDSKIRAMFYFTIISCKRSLYIFLYCFTAFFFIGIRFQPVFFENIIIFQAYFFFTMYSDLFKMALFRIWDLHVLFKVSKFQNLRILTIFRSYFGRNDDFKTHSEINWPLGL